MKVKKTAKTLTSAKKAGRAKTQISISIPSSILEEVDRLAELENRNRSNYISKLLIESIQGDK